MFAAGMMTSRLFCIAGALAPKARSANGVTTVCSMASGGGVPTGDEQVMGCRGRSHSLDARALLTLYTCPKATSATKKDPNLVPSITNKQKLGYTCQEDNSAAMN